MYKRKGNLSHRELDDLLAKKENFATQIPQIDAKINAAKIGLATPVSYTHLDVYKRQK